MNGADGKSEVIIIRRKGGEEVAAHKGGAWKIAYADFVTAMMAFFLVMWLINAANEATRAQVASYFNPIKLTDNATGGRGLNDPKDVKSKEKQNGAATADKATEGEKKKEEQALADPAKTLESIAGPAIAVEVKPDATAAVAGAPEVPSDPFDPLAWQSAQGAAKAPVSPDVPKPAKAQAAHGKPATEQAPPGAAADHDAENAAAQNPKAAGVSESKVVDKPPQASAAGAADKPAAADHPEPQQSKTPEPAAKPPEHDAAPGAETAAAAAAAAARGAKLAAEIKSDILKHLNMNPGDLPASLEVTSTAEGQLIRLTDRTAFGMFELGSSRPSPKLVVLMAAIAAAVEDRPGYVVVRGHTDSRPYHNTHYDNWQLSAARAQVAYYMLTRGGLDAARVARIEGHADRQPAIPDHPDAPENRRIEILLGQTQ